MPGSGTVAEWLQLCLGSMRLLPCQLRSQWGFCLFQLLQTLSSTQPQPCLPDCRLCHGSGHSRQATVANRTVLHCFRVRIDKTFPGGGLEATWSTAPVPYLVSLAPVDSLDGGTVRGKRKTVCYFLTQLTGGGCHWLGVHFRLEFYLSFPTHFSRH